MKDSTVRLFVGAMGSILDISPADNYSEYRNMPPDSDLIRGDWVTVGNQLRNAIIEHETSQRPSQDDLEATAYNTTY